MSKQFRMNVNEWLAYAQRLNALAQNGLAFNENEYDRERYEEIRSISQQMLANLFNISPDMIAGLMPSEAGYQTPKVDIRAVVLDGSGKLLMVREKIDAYRWSLPGGWADVGYSPFEVAQKEVLEETGLQVIASRLLAVFDKRKHSHPLQPWYVYKFYILCEVVGGELLTDTVETGDASWVNTAALPELDLSTDRVTLAQLQLALEKAVNPNAASLCD